MNVSIVYGGKSGEHEVSLRSAATVFNNLDRGKYTCTLIGIDKNGVWYLQDSLDYDGSPPSVLRVSAAEDRIVSAVPGRGLAAGERMLHTDFVFPVLHGSFGEDGTVQGMLELTGLPYAGAGVLGTALSMDKRKVKEVWQYHQLPVVPYAELSVFQFSSPQFSAEPYYRTLSEHLGTRLFIKPCSAGSSLGVHAAANPRALAAALEDAFLYDTQVLIERAVTGREIECAVLGNREVRTSVPGQIVPAAEFYDYKAKYVDPEGAALIIPAELSKDVSAAVRSLAEKAYRAAGIEGMARVDFFIEDNTEHIYINEVNTIPGFTSISMFPLLFAETGTSCSELISAVIELGFSRHRERAGLHYSYAGS